MQKYKQVNVVHPEDVGVPRKLMSDPPRENSSSSVFRRSLWPIMIIALIILSLAVCFLPWPTQIQLTIPGAQLNVDGSVFENGEIIIDAWMYNYLFRNDEFHINELQLPDNEAEIIIKSIRTNFSYSETLDLYYADFASWSPEVTSQSITYGVVYFTSDQLNWVIKLNDRTFVGTTVENFVYAEILRRFGWMID